MINPNKKPILKVSIRDGVAKDDVLTALRKLTAFIETEYPKQDNWQAGDKWMETE